MAFVHPFWFLWTFHVQVQALCFHPQVGEGQGCQLSSVAAVQAQALLGTTNCLLLQIVGITFSCYLISSLGTRV
jgi:hypothetical protein